MTAPYRGMYVKTTNTNLPDCCVSSGGFLFRGEEDPVGLQALGAENVQKLRGGNGFATLRLQLQGDVPLPHHVTGDGSH